MKGLLIAEKPSLMATIKETYNKEKGSLSYTLDFVAQAGHLMGLKLPNEIDKKYEKWDMENFPITVGYEYKVLAGKLDLLNRIKTALKTGGYDFVYHAGDPDDEGELLVRLVLNELKVKTPVKRFWTNDLTPGAISAELHKLRDDKDYDSIYQAALLRQHLDYQFGMNLTGVFTLKAGKTMKTGRVKAATNSLIVKREREILNWKDSSKFKHAFKYGELEFTNDTEYKAEGEARTFLPRGEFATVTSVENKTTKKKAPKLYKLSTLQGEASKLYKMKASKTLEIMQSLYEKKGTTYPRTGCEYLFSTTDVGDILKKVCCLVPVAMSDLKDPNLIRKDTTYANDKAAGEEGHTALIPTGNIPTGLTADEQKLYDLVLRRFVAIFAPDKEIHSITVKANVETGQKDPVTEEYSYHESEDVSAGFELILDPKYKKKTMPAVNIKQGQTLKPIEKYVKEIKAKPPVRYNDASLIAMMDSPEEFRDANGKLVKYTIGRPSSRAKIIDDCIACGYFATDNKGYYYPTELGFYYVDTFGYASLFDITTTAYWETLLQRVRTKELVAGDVEKEMLDSMNQIITETKAKDIKRYGGAWKGTGTGKSAGGKGSSKLPGIGAACPLCGGNLFKAKSKNTGTVFYGCENWNKDPKCSFTMWEKFCGATLTESDVKKLVKGSTIEKELTSKAGKQWKQKIKYLKDEKKIDFVKG